MGLSGLGKGAGVTGGGAAKPPFTGGKIAEAPATKAPVTKAARMSKPVTSRRMGGGRR